MEKPNTTTPNQHHIDTLGIVHDLSMSDVPVAASFGRCAKALLEAQATFLKDERARCVDPNVTATAYIKESVGPLASHMTTFGLIGEPEVAVKEIATYFEKALLDAILLMQMAPRS